MFSEMQIDLVEVPFKTISIFQADDRRGTVRDRLIEIAGGPAVEMKPFAFPRNSTFICVRVITVKKYDLTGKCPEYLTI